MARKPRIAPGGMVYHVLNRTAGKFKFLRRPKDYDAFENLLIQAHAKHPLRILSYCFMPTHWHFVAYPEGDGDLTAFFRWLTHTHAMRWRVAHGTVGYGHLYQGRFKSFLVERDEYLLNVCRYVERNALTAGLVERAEQWRWNSLWAREHGSDALRAILSPWPMERPGDWVEHVNEPISAKELQRLQECVARGRPLGSEAWTRRVVAKLHLEHTIQPKGRPPVSKQP